MKIEHLALTMEDPIEAAKWYSENLGFTIIKQMSVSPFAHFIADSSRNILLEIFRLPDKSVPDYKSIHPATMHLGFSVEDIELIYQKLVSSGVVVVNEISVSKSGDRIAMLRDPWGIPIQIIQRKEPII